MTTKTLAGPFKHVVVWTVATLALLLLAGSTWRAAQSATPESRPFDDVPGMGMSGGAAARDDALAYWESYRREEATRDCMAQRGFRYHPDAAFPTDAIIGVASTLSVEPAAPPESDPTEANGRVREALSAEELDAYFQALYGETAADMQTFQTGEGRIPSGRDPEAFARGGCVGSAAQSVGSIWQLRRDLTPALDEWMSDVRRSRPFRDRAAKYSDCVQSKAGRPAADPGEVEANHAAATTKAERSRWASADECIHLWTQAWRAGQQALEEDFKSRHQGVIEAQQSRYANAMQAIDGDEGFKRHLAEAAGRARSNGPEHE